ncbi:hypothetical protein DVH05_024467, partial [Phytophthora capsici]
LDNAKPAFAAVDADPSNSEQMADTAQSARISQKQAQSHRADRNAQAEGGTDVLTKYDTCV